MNSSETMEIPEEFEFSYEDGVLEIGKEGESVRKKLDHAMVEVETSGNELRFVPLSEKRDVTSVVGTFRSHAENMMQGLKDKHVYRLKGVYAHFPMTIDRQGDEIHIENFMGERADRVVEIMDGVEVEIEGDDVTMKSADKEAVAQTAARLEQVCFKGDRDPRTFQDGVYIIEGDKE
ncbi:MAG: 50S ribosomal protein L6 [Candidatus Nanohaloarchaea archaeon]